MTTKFYLDFRNKAKDKKGNLVLLIFNRGKSASIPMQLRLLKSEWKNGKIVSRPDSTELNILITNKKNEIDKRLALLGMEKDLDSLSMPEIKNIVETKQRAVVQIDKRSLDYLFNTYLETDLRDGTKEIYTTTLCKVKKFGGANITIDKITYEWLIGFEKFLAQSQGVNGRGIYLRALRTICNFAVHLKITDKYAFEDFSIKTEQTRKRSVSVETLRKFYSVPVSESERRYRDYFFLMFFLIGINIGDLLRLKSDAVVGDRLEYIRAKTHKKYSIKLEPEALEILNRYKGENYLLDALDTCKHIKSFMHEMNDALKGIGESEEDVIPSDDIFGKDSVSKKKIPVIPDCTTYFSRHCWATYAYEIGVSFDTISQALGHSSGNRTTLIYIQFNQEKIDNANRQVLDYFFGKTTIHQE